MHPPDRFTCEEVFARLDDYLDRELTAEEMRLVREHMETCAACASEYRFESGIIEGVREKLRRLAVPEDLMARISARLAADAERRNGGKAEGRE
jgi:anti-sigma factor (TIGR02949 family)